MKIYNEIVIDMNPESSSYRETLHEDSFEYDGPMALCSHIVGQPHEGDMVSVVNPDGGYWHYEWTGGDWSKYETLMDYATGTTYSTENLMYFTTTGASKTVEEDPTYVAPDTSGNAEGGLGFGMSADAEAHAQAIADAITGNLPYDAQYDTNNDGVISALDLPTYTATQEMGEREFTRGEGGQFDPTSGEFQTYVETTGGFDALLSGFGVDADKQQFFDPVNIEKLDIYQESFDIAGRGIAEDKRKAKTTFDLTQQQVGIEEEKAGLMAGRSMFDIQQQGAQQTATSGFATHGGIESTMAAAQGGVWQDLTMQQETLATTMGEARSNLAGAYTTANIQTDVAQLELDTSVSDFWEREEEKFYATLGQVYQYD